MTVVDVGTPPSGFLTGFLARDSILIAFHGFADLSVTPGLAIDSPKFTCFGRQWLLSIHPGGDDEKCKGMISVYLQHISSGSARVQYGFTIKDAQGETVFASFQDLHQIVHTFSDPSEGYGYPGFVKRSSIMNALVNGALVIGVQMKLLKQDTLPFIPKNPADNMNVFGMYVTEPSDIVFEVDREQPRRKTRSSFDAAHVKFHAHRLVVEKYAPELAKDQLCGSGSAGDVARVSVTNVKPEVFRIALNYMYGGEIPKEDLKSFSKEIIEAAHRFGMVHLKQTAEASYVQMTQIEADTLMEHLLFAKENDCALLKEAVVDFIVESGCEIDHLPKKVTDAGLAADIHRATSKKAGIDKYSRMRVNELRKMLEEKGLDIGGTKKKMIDTLREVAQTKRGEE